MHRGRARGNLCFEVGNRGLRDAMEQLAENSRLVIEKTLNGGESSRFSFDHVTCKSPGGTGKAQHGNFRSDGLHDAADGFGQKFGFHFRIEIP